jgi:hypothetical protein
MTGYLNTLYTLLGSASVIMEFAGLVICIRYLRLSSSMPLLVLAFAGLAGGGIISQLLYFSFLMGVLPGELHAGVSAVALLFRIAGNGALVLGLWLVLRDIHDRFQFQQEIDETMRERGAAKPAFPHISI